MATTYYIVWWEYFDYEDGQYDEDGCTGYAEDHYVSFETLEDAQQMLPHYLELDPEAHII